MKLQYPFSFAVFYHCVIKHCSSFTQQLTVHALFYGQIINPNEFLNKISDATISEYVKAKRPVRAELVNKVCSTPLNELRENIEILYIQDTAHAIEAIKRMLSIVKISAKLKRELLDEADREEDRTRYIAKIFQESVKCYELLNLSKEQIIFLDSVWNGTDQDIENNITGREKHQMGDALEYEESDEIKRLLEEEPTDENTDLFFSGGTIKYSSVSLPEDFDTLVRYINQKIGKSLYTNLTFEDVAIISEIDISTKTIKRGGIGVIEIYGRIDFCIRMLSDLPDKEKMCSCLMVMITGYKTSHPKVEELLSAFWKNNSRTKLKFGISLVEYCKEGMIQIILVAKY